jgi:hypothetical protein
MAGWLWTGQTFFQPKARNPAKDMLKPWQAEGRTSLIGLNAYLENGRAEETRGFGEMAGLVNLLQII